MFTTWKFTARALFVLVFAVMVPYAWGQESASNQPASPIKAVEISPAEGQPEVGQKMRFTATAKDAEGKAVNEKAQVWFALPSDVAHADESGTVTFFNPGAVKVGAVVGGKFGMTIINVKPASVTSIDIEPLAAPLVVKGTAQLIATARTANGNPRREATISWTSLNPAIATVDAAGVVLGLAPGKATLRATSDAASNTVTVEVIANPARALSITPGTANARTGDVVRFVANATGAGGSAMKSPAVRWTVSGEGAMIESDGRFVAERPGSYVVTATSGDSTAVASVVVKPRAVERDTEVVGRIPLKDIQAAEQWIFGNYAYVSTIADKLFVYDISDPAKPRELDSVKVDTRVMNDVSVTADGKIGVLTREGASSRKDGIVFLDTSDPAHPKILSEYTETVSGGVHSAYLDSHYVYLTDDATGSMRVIDFKDVKAPKEVARWQVENPLVGQGGLGGGRYLHDVQVKDGLAYLAYWRDGLVILDVGNGIKGGSPEKPQFVSQLRFNYHELYGNGWLAGAHAVYRYKNYVFVGDEVFPEMFDINAKQRIPVRGIVHVVDVSDITRPHKVAEYSVPEAGAHNMWVEDDVLYMGYYNGGARVLDVSGELRGELYRQGREIAKIWTGAPDGYRPNMPFAWGAQPHKGLIFFNDINTGIWIVKLGRSTEQGSTTFPGK